MSVSHEDKVRSLYDATAGSYDAMMDQEIQLPLYDRVVLATGGHLFLAAWEGNGNIDYGEASDVIARRYKEAEIVNATSRSRLQVVRHSVEPVDEMEMDAVHLVAVKP